MKKNIENDLQVKEYPVVKNILYCLKATIEHYPLLLLWCAIAIIVNVLLPVLTMYLPKEVIERISSKSSLESLITVVVALTLSIAVLLGVKRFTERFIYHHKFKMSSFYMRKIANKGMTTDYANQEKEHFRKLQSESFNSCNGHYSRLTQIYDTGVALFSNGLGFIVYFGILTRLNVFLVLFLVGTTLISYVLNKKIIKWTSENNKEKIGYGQKIGYINLVSGDVKSAKDIRLYNMFVWFENIYTNNSMALSNWYKRYSTKIFKVAIFDGGLALLREGAAYAYLLYLVLSNQINVADFVLFFGAITGFSGWLAGIFGQLNSVNSISLSINYLRAFLEYPESYKREGGKDVLMTTFPKKIELKNVSYRYEGAEDYTLKNINLTLHPNEHLAIVGLNGAGKTTLVKLICGLCDPTDGVVLYDGLDVKEYNRISYYKLFSAVFQQFSLLPVTIEEIVAENSSESIDSTRVESCLMQAGLWKKIESLPNGVKSNFSKMIHDDGVEFSGGEIQKLLLARALYKNSPVMILDEPTAALDPISESNLYEIYSSLMSGKSTIFISHRLASTRFCNRILLIENGSFCEEGTHDSLLKQRSRYYDLFETQAKYYRENPISEEVEYE